MKPAHHAESHAELVAAVEGLKRPATCHEIAQAVHGENLSNGDSNRIRHRLERLADKGVLAAILTRRGAMLVTTYCVASDPTHRLACAYTTDEVIRNEIEDAVVDALTKHPALTIYELRAIMPKMRASIRNKRPAVLGLELVWDIADDLVDRMVLVKSFGVEAGSVVARYSVRCGGAA